MDRFSFHRASAAVAAAETHGALELLAAQFWSEVGADWRCAVALERRIDERHQVIARCEALIHEIALGDDGEEAAW